MIHLPQRNLTRLSARAQQGWCWVENRFNKYKRPAALPFKGNRFTDDLGVDGVTEDDIYRSLGAEPQPKENRFAKYLQQEQFGPQQAQNPEQLAPPEQESKTNPLQRALNVGAAYADARTFGLGPKLAAGVGSAIAMPVLEAGEAVNNAMGGDFEAPAFKDLYKNSVDRYSGLGKQAFKDDPILAFGASVAGGLKSAQQVAGTKIGTKVADWAGRGGLGTRMLKGGLVAAPGGAVYGAGSSEVGDELSGAAKGAGGTAVLGAAFPPIAAAVSKLNTKTLIPNSDKIKEAASGLYQKAEQFGGAYKAEFTNKFLQKAQKSLLSDDVLINEMKSNAPMRAAFEDLASFQNQPMTLNRAQALDEQLGNMIDGFVDVQGNLSKQGKKLLEVQRGFRNLIETADDNLLEGGREGFEALKEGRKLWAVSRRLADVERIIEGAEMYSVPATAIKTGFRRLANSSKILGYSPEEAKAIERAAKTGVVTDVMATLGSRLLPIVGMGGGPKGAALGIAASTAARAGATASQTGRANEAAKLIAQRSGMVEKQQRISLPTFRQIMKLPPKQAKAALEKMNLKAKK
jgi:hypothetical protein